MKRTRWFLLLMALFILVSCGGDEGNTTAGTEVDPINMDPAVNPIVTSCSDFISRVKNNQFPAAVAIGTPCYHFEGSSNDFNTFTAFTKYYSNGSIGIDEHVWGNFFDYVEIDFGQSNAEVLASLISIVDSGSLLSCARIDSYKYKISVREGEFITVDVNKPLFANPVGYEATFKSGYFETKYSYQLSTSLCKKL